MSVHLFERIIGERKRLGLTQDQMAAAGGVAKRTYCNYESGARQPPLEFLKKLGEVGAEVDFLIHGINSPGERLRGERTRLGYTIQQFAEKGGVSVEAQRSYENDEAEPDSNYFNKLSETEADIFWIWRGSKEDDEVREKGKLPYTPVIREFIKDYLLCSDTVQKSLRDLAKDAADKKRLAVKEWNEKEGKKKK